MQITFCINLIFQKKNQERIKNLDDFHKDKTTIKKFSKKNLNKLFYYKGKENVIDILNFKIFKSKILDNDILELLNFYKDKPMPQLPVRANTLMEKYKIPQGKILGDMLKIIEEEWVNNNFQISDQQIKNIINS